MIALAAHDLKHLYRFLGIWGSASEAYCPARLGQSERLRYAHSGTDRRCHEQVAHRSVLWTERRIGASSAVYEHMVRWQDRGGYARIVEAARTKRVQWSVCGPKRPDRT
jgi:hypothetical protein